MTTAKLPYFSILNPRKVHIQNLSGLFIPLSFIHNFCLIAIAVFFFLFPSDFDYLL